LLVPDAGHAIGSYRISPDSQWVVYQDFVSLSNITLRAIPAVGGSPVTLGLGADQLITPDSQRVIYGKRRGVRTMKDIRLKVEIAPPSPGDLSPSFAAIRVG
jgi:hypothetical protein